MDSPRKARLPSLAALRAFEAVARNVSFTKAAAELRLTQGAVSYQIKQLEEEVGVALFIRNGRRVNLSSEAAFFLPTLQNAFSDISRGILGMRTRSGKEPVLIALSTYFAAHWLLKRLPRFWRLHPKIELRFHHSESLAAPDIHLTIRWRKAGRKDDADPTHLLFLSDVTPVCSPSLSLTTTKDLTRYTLLRDEVTAQAWTAWLKRARLRGREGFREMNIDDPNVYIQAAIDGQGVALGDDLIDDEIALGRLVRPFNIKLHGYGYFVTGDTEALKNTNVAAFRDWLLAEAKAPFE